MTIKKKTNQKKNIELLFSNISRISLYLTFNLKYIEYKKHKLKNGGNMDLTNMSTEAIELDIAMRTACIMQNPDITSEEADKLAREEFKEDMECEKELQKQKS